MRIRKNREVENQAREHPFILYLYDCPFVQRPVSLSHSCTRANSPKALPFYYNIRYSIAVDRREKDGERE